MLPSLISNFKAWLPWQNVGQISTVNKHCETASLNCDQAAVCKQNAFVSAVANTSLLWLQTTELKMLRCWLCENMLWRYCWKKARFLLILIKKKNLNTESVTFPWFTITKETTCKIQVILITGHVCMCCTTHSHSQIKQKET